MLRYLDRPAQSLQILLFLFHSRHRLSHIQLGPLSLLVPLWVWVWLVCLLSGSNNDITRTEEIKERALLHAGVKHYFVVRFPQRAGALKEFIEKVLGPKDDITHFEYSKKQSRTNAPAVVGIELGNSDGLRPLVNRMKEFNFFGEYLNDKPDLFQFLV